MARSLICSKCGKQKENPKSSYCRACKAEHSRKQYASNPDIKRDYVLRYRYGITLEDYKALLVKQNNACAICFKRCITGKELAVDHHHGTGEVRGLLCYNCNSGIAKFNEDSGRLYRAMLYIERFD